mgnify:CR=1 FL=1
MPKWAEKHWVRLAERSKYIASLDDALTRAHNETIKGVAVVDDFLFTAAGMALASCGTSRRARCCR